MGRGLATAFGEQGAALVIAKIDPQAADAIVGDFTAQGITARAYRCDVADYADVRRAVDGAIHDLGSLHVLVNNAGVSFVGPPTEDTDVDVWRRSVDMMQSGVVYCSQVVGRHFLQQRHGNIINSASMCGFSSIRGGCVR